MTHCPTGYLLNRKILAYVFIPLRFRSFGSSAKRRILVTLF